MLATRPKRTNNDDRDGQFAYFGEGVGVLFPHFDVKQAEDVSVSDFVATVEEEACEILSDMSDKEYLA